MCRAAVERVLRVCAVERVVVMCGAHCRCSCIFACISACMFMCLFVALCLADTGVVHSNTCIVYAARVKKSSGDYLH